jgi:hypothetical protein
MGRPKSFLVRLEVDVAKKSHNCQHSNTHRIAMGDSRLKVTEGRSSEYYCALCGLKFLETDAGRIAVLLAQLRPNP